MAKEFRYPKAGNDKINKKELLLMKTLLANRITRTITARTINYAFLTDELEVRKARTVAFGTNPANIPAGAKIISTSSQTFKCSMSIEKFFELCDKDVIVE